MSIGKIVMRIISISFTALVFIGVVYGLYQLGLRSYSYGYRIFAEPAITDGKGTERMVQVTELMSDADVGALLEEKGLIRDKWLFVFQLKLSEYNNKLVPGYYTLSTSMTAHEMMQVMSGEEDTEESDDGVQ